MTDRSSRPSKRDELRWLTALFLVAAMLLSGCASGGGGGGGGLGGIGDDSDDDENGPGKFADNSTMKMIQSRGKLIVGTNFDAAPFAYKDPSTGSPAGFDVEMAKQVAIGIFGSQIEGKIDFVPLDPRDRELALEQNKVDIAIGRYAITVPRKGFVDFAGPYYTARQSVLAHVDADELENLADLNGKKVCVVRGSTNVDALKKAVPSIDASMMLNSVSECGAQLLAKKVDGVAAERVDMLPFWRASESRVRFVQGDFGQEPYGIGVHKGTTDLRQYINDRLDKTEDNWEDLYERTVGNDDNGVKRPPVDRY